MSSPQQLCLGTQPPTDHVVLIGRPVLERPAEGWDTLRERLWLPHEFWIPRGAVRDGPGPEGGIFIAQDFRTIEWWGGRPVVEVISLGIATQGGKDFKLESSCGISEDLSLASGTYLSPTIWRTGYPRVTKLWVSPTTVAIYDHVGLPSVPPETFGIGGAAWSMSWTAADNWSASGWMGESRTPQRLPGSAYCLVTDTWVYDVGYADRDGVAPGIIYL